MNKSLLYSASFFSEEERKLKYAKALKQIIKWFLRALIVLLIWALLTAAFYVL